jgi:phosphatidylinositol glycan class A protein
MHARTMGKHVVYTDHSLFAFNDIACINLNKVIKSYLTDIDQTISVSYIGRDNLILRTLLNPRICNVIPNGVDFSKFKPIDRDYNDRINIVCISRHTYRKGVDLLIEVIPVICKKYNNVYFLIGGDGPKRILLENMIKSFNIEDRVALKGSLAHNNVRDLLIQGHIYLNTSLTEAFCIAIVEAASTGLYVVSTNIGGVEEVLPENMIRLVDAERDSIVKGLEYAISNYHNIKNSTKFYHDRLKTTYNWNRVAMKTVILTNKVSSL